MTWRGIKLVISVALAATALAALSSSAAQADETVTLPFPGGSITNLTVDGAYTHGSFDGISLDYGLCGSPNQVACTWQAWAVLSSLAAESCLPGAEGTTLLWDSGPQTLNGHVESSSRSFALEGSPGQALCLILNQTSTNETEFGQVKIGGTMPLLVVPFGPGPIDITKDIAFPNHPDGDFFEFPDFKVSIHFSGDCNSVTIEATRYTFNFSHMGCWKATQLATKARETGAAPSGYRCKDKRAGGAHCSRIGRPAKFFEWRAKPSRSSTK